MLMSGVNLISFLPFLFLIILPRWVVTLYSELPVLSGRALDYTTFTGDHDEFKPVDAQLLQNVSLAPRMRNTGKGLVFK